ncbi:Fe-S cluster assembly sulfur transfer protein SufU [Mesoplasma lactucae]|uniref:SUF system NifU family Fe-S cluster assembly protein n=1 Tax=Mesoplasma lactucae ATCC 49193 TaxID=81460 RepID=A0A291IRV5_9MOLU|nr:SUF system NifU family Fe-S cluster assembly protein [Mesoplasma lactucae]ATG97513.1 SUF system NifU family Fe-S cluster assembly protein [Mesoplasma lactucae ATCC 49193]ATZ20031.1 FeS assembly protein [Mesoplasma lactucae ATCC 49193]MCL8217018.1 Zinc-dependent sulfurtransferase SufU [Mesoplasma lactucae ATCC 49193]
MTRDMKHDRQLLMDHYTKPENKGFNPNQKGYQKRLKSDSCADELTIQILSHDNVIDEIKFEGSACVIATSSFDLLINLLKGKNYTEAMDLLTTYEDMIQTGNINEEKLQDLVIFSNVHKQKNRWKCAQLGANGVIEFINSENIEK